jgi:hypothetical protein
MVEDDWIMFTVALLSLALLLLVVLTPWISLLIPQVLLR